MLAASMDHLAGYILTQRCYICSLSMESSSFLDRTATRLWNSRSESPNYER